MSDHDEDRLRDETHQVITDQLREHELVDDDAIVSKWILCYETVNPSGVKSAGFIHGPQGMSSWDSVGLLEWIREFLVTPS